MVLLIWKWTDKYVPMKRGLDDELCKKTEQIVHPPPKYSLHVTLWLFDFSKIENCTPRLHVPFRRRIQEMEIEWVNNVGGEIWFHTIHNLIPQWNKWVDSLCWRGVWRCTQAKLVSQTPHHLAQDRLTGPASKQGGTLWGKHLFCPHFSTATGVCGWCNYTLPLLDSKLGC